MYIPNRTKPRETGAQVALVSYSGAEGFGAVGSCERRDQPVFAPRGISYRPCEGDRALLIPVGGAEACAGVLCTAGDLEPGELRLSSAGGASIVLKNNGEILLNGLAITPDGQLRQP